MIAATHTKRGRGFTLVELMVAIAIIGILAALLLGVAARAGQTARESKSKSMVARLHSLLMERYDLYRTRRVDLGANWRNAAGVPQNSGITFGNLDARLHEAGGRLVALRELMKLEMPDRWSDVIGRPVDSPPREWNSVFTQFLEAPPALSSTYLRAYNEAVDRGVDRETLWANQGAECLYLVIMNATGDGEARGLFHENDVGDTDGDGAPEFLDGWGQPISYVRWAPGFDSDTQLSYDDWFNPTVGGEEIRNDIAEDHDPYDLFRVDRPSDDNADLQAAADHAGLRGWRLAPLIYSPGADGVAGIETAQDFVQLANPYAVARTTGGDSYWLGSVTVDDQGTSLDDFVSDNIHNHNLATLSRSR